MAKITINGVSIDPVAGGPALAAAGFAAPAAPSDFLLVQTKAPLDKDQRAALAKKGAEVIEYVPDETYICRGKSAKLADVRALPFVAWADVYMKQFKLAPSLLQRADGPAPAEADMLSLAGKSKPTLARAPRKVDIVFHEGVDAEKLRAKLAAAARVDPAGIKIGAKKVRLTVAERDLAAIADLDEVRNVEEATERKLHNNVARQILKIESPGAAPVPYEGKNQVVAVADTGLDKGSKTDVHPAFKSRVKKIYALGRPNNASDPDGHGTHVAGSVLGDGDSQLLHLKIRGTAPKAKLIFQSVLDASGGLGGLPDDLHDLFDPIYSGDKARIHTNSWGSVRGDGNYDANCRELDDFVWSHRDMVVCFAAGNEGIDKDSNGQIDPRSVTPPGTAKNCITVGASENLRPNFNLTYGHGWPQDYPAAPIAGDPVADNPEGMAAFSSRGPTKDKRVKPDVVAPGTYILSTKSRVAAGSGWSPSPDPLYFYEGGTSMATPLVAGCVAVVREMLGKKYQLASPSAALVKAMLINGAHDLGGQYVPTETGATPNYAEGFGRVDMAATVGDLPAGSTLQIKEEAKELDTGDSEKTTVVVPAGAKMLKVTLVWSDLPGETLQNDLDLIVRPQSGGERHGNMPATSAKFDRVNNVEQVVWAGVSAGAAEITVRSFRSVRPQSYALVIRIA